MGRQPSVDSKRFYPKEAKTSEARLRHYATSCRLVEIDNAYYALPAPSVAALRTQRTPEVWKETDPKLAIFRLHGRNAATWDKKGLTASSGAF